MGSIKFLPAATTHRRIPPGTRLLPGCEAVALDLADNRRRCWLPKAKASGLENPPKKLGQDDQLMRIVHYKSVAVKLVIHAGTVKNCGFHHHADFHAFYYDPDRAAVQTPAPESTR
jgi:hypothetical protein